MERGVFLVFKSDSEGRNDNTLFDVFHPLTPRVKPWVIQSFLTFDSKDGTLKCGFTNYDEIFGWDFRMVRQNFRMGFSEIFGWDFRMGFSDGSTKGEQIKILNC